ncbi:MAG: dihydroorotate dehydrogenase-like protein [Paracoccaceae bacterium]
MDMTTSYLGMSLRNPLVASASPLNGKLDNIRRLEDHGVAAVVLPSIFEEQIAREQELFDALMTTGIDTYGEALTYFPSQTAYALNTDRYIEVIEAATAAVDIPVIASLNGISDHGWIDYARLIEEAGAAAIELNIYFIPSDLTLSGRDVEERYLSVVRAVKETVEIPVAVKIGTNFSAPGHMAMQLDQAGADGLVLFNRFYEPDIDLTQLTLVSDLELSSPYEIRLPLLWIGVLSGRVTASLAASSGVESGDEVLKYLLAGADVVMTTSALLRHGIEHVRVLLDQLESWLAAREIDSPDRIRGRMNHDTVDDPAVFERANYIKILQGYPAS